MALNILSHDEVSACERINAYLTKVNSKLTSKEWVETQVHQRYFKVTFDGCFTDEEKRIMREKMHEAKWTIIAIDVKNPVDKDGIGSTHMTFM